MARAARTFRTARPEPAAEPAPTIRVRVGTVRTYPLRADELAEHLDTGGQILALPAFIAYARKWIADSACELVARGWVHLDSSPLAYMVMVTESGYHSIIGAAPMPGAALEEIYSA